MKSEPGKILLDDVSVFTRLSKVGLEIFPITIGSEIRELLVSRRGLLSKHFGGCSRGTFPSIKKEKFERHGFDNFMYVHLVSERAQTMVGERQSQLLTGFVSHSTLMSHRFQERRASGHTSGSPNRLRGKMCG